MLTYALIVTVICLILGVVIFFLIKTSNSDQKEFESAMTKIMNDLHISDNKLSRFRNTINDTFTETEKILLENPGVKNEEIPNIIADIADRAYKGVL